MSLGEKLCNARLALKQTTSEVATGTRMKVQTVEYLEREEFDKIPAPIYAKGFIKLYAEHVGLEAQPLIDEYMERFSGSRQGALGTDGQPRVQKLLDGSKSPDGEPGDAPEDTDLFDHTHANAPSYANENAPRPSLSDLWSRIADALAIGLRKLGQLSGSRQNQRSDEAASPAAAVKNLSWKSVASVAGVLIVLACVAAGIQQCRRNRGPERPVVAMPEDLQLAVEPPDPYID